MPYSQALHPWPRVKVSDLGMIQSGGTPSRNIPAYWNGDIPWVTPGELTRHSEKYISNTHDRITKAGLANSGATLVPPSSLLVTSRASIGSVALASVPMTTNQGFKTIVFRSGIEPSFYYHLFKTLGRELIRRASGTTFLEISSGQFGDIEVVAPPFPEQRRIAEILDTLDEAILKTEQLIAKLELTKKGLLHDLLTKGVDENGEIRDPSLSGGNFTETPLGALPSNYIIAPIDDFLERIIDYRGKTPPKSSSGIPLITARNVRVGYFDPDPREFIPEKIFGQWMNRGTPEPGDVMFTTEAPLGNVAAVPAYPAAFGQRLIMLCAKKGLLSSRYLLWMLLHQASQSRIRQYSTGSTVLGIKASVFRRLRFAFPPIEEQTFIANTLDAVQNQISAETVQLAKLRLLKHGLMHDLLTGRVRTTSLDASTPEFVTAP